MPRSKRPWLSCTLLGMALLAGCGTSTHGSSQPTSTTAAGPPVVKVTTTKLGPTLTDAAGVTLYVTDNDPNGEVTCQKSLCSLRFSAMTVPTRTVAVGPGLSASKFTTIELVDGRLVLAVDGRALYRFHGDTAPGQVTGNGDSDVWHAVHPNGVAFAN
jgi:predicted lipoprotein with Yx(FWY)xxD motif